MVKINLSHLLSERHMKQVELARLTGIRPSTICDICNNTCSFLKIEHIDLICSMLGCKVEELIDIEQRP